MTKNTQVQDLNETNLSIDEEQTSEFFVHPVEFYLSAAWSPSITLNLMIESYLNNCIISNIMMIIKST